jgi:hypothetical protein
MGAFVWERSRIVGMGWSGDEELVVVEADGGVWLYSTYGDPLPRRFSLGAVCREQGVARAEVFSSGVVALTERHELWAVTGFAEPRPQVTLAHTSPLNLFSIINKYCQRKTTEKCRLWVLVLKSILCGRTYTYFCSNLGQCSKYHSERWQLNV